ncbi:MAG: hypothetical protein OHK0029_02990 [Armatimonadaceae bacterium]
MFVRGSRNIGIENESQAVRLERDAPTGRLILRTFVRRAGKWAPVFDAGVPIVSGQGFDLAPNAYRVIEDSPAQKSLRLTGTQATLRYPFEMDISLHTGSPLIRFTVTCRLDSPLSCSTQCDVGLWRNGPVPTVVLNQGPESIYRDSGGGAPFGYGFPAAYIWHDGVEAAIFFDLTTAAWMSANGVRRFENFRVQSWERNGQWGLGLHGRSVSGRNVPKGELKLDFYLYTHERRNRPIGLEALETMVRVFAPVFPTPVPVRPVNYRDAGKLSWEFVAKSVLRDLMQDGRTIAEVPATWTDNPLPLAKPVERIVVHPAVPHREQDANAMGWDFSTVNNHLTPWLLFTKIHPDSRAQELGTAKVRALPAFFDPRAGLIRWGTRVPEHIGDMEMLWQNLFFHIETERASNSSIGAEISEFVDAVRGRFLMSLQGLRQLAHNVDYLFPQWFDPYQKQPAIQSDVPRLGKVREPWQAGSYAYVMLRGHAIAGESRYLEEARTALRRLFERPGYTMTNSAYQVHYTDPADYPVTELFGNAYGAVAAYQLYEQSRNSTYLRWSRYCVSTLLRLSFWHEDRTDPISCSLNRLGLFLPHGGAAAATPWESTEAHLTLAWLIWKDRKSPLLPLLLQLSHRYRTSSLGFFPPFFPPAVQALDPSLQKSDTPYLPIEPFYSLEALGGHRSPQAAYMGGTALWNYWLFEALAIANDPEILVLNTDTLGDYEGALSGLRFRLVVYNPTKSSRSFRVSARNLPEGSYSVIVEDPAGRKEQHLSGKALTQIGTSIRLNAGGYVHITITRSDAKAALAALKSRVAAQNQAAVAYQRAQEAELQRGIKGKGAGA